MLLGDYGGIGGVINLPLATFLSEAPRVNQVANWNVPAYLQTLVLGEFPL